MERRVVIVGAGAMGRSWAKNLQGCGKTLIVGWVDLNHDLATQAVDDLDLDDIVTGDELEPVVEKAKPDFIVDVTSPEAHRDITVKALKMGLPVIGEKPMTTSIENAKEMVKASEESGKLYMVSQSRRYNAQLAAYKKLVQELGPLGILNADFYLGAHFGGFRDEMKSPLILDMAIHTFDAARYISDTDPELVYCEEFNPSWSWYKGDACAYALFDMEGGLRFCYRGGWCTEGRHTSWESEWRSIGPKGSATWDGSGAPRAETVKKQSGFFSETDSKTEKGDEASPVGINGSIRDFLNALDHNTTPMGECHDNIKSFAMVLGAMESSDTGKRVNIANMLK
jgi:predicted dehydrogenase